jgi:antitoxin MazE
MNAHFSKWGNSIALRIPNGVAKELNVSERSKASLQVRDGALVVIPVGAVPKYDINKLIAAITPENLHGETDTGGPVGNEYFPS